MGLRRRGLLVGVPIGLAYLFGVDALVGAAAIFAVCFLVGLPLAYVLLATGFAFLTFVGASPLLYVPPALERGISSYVLLAVPFFLIAGVLMTASGMARRVIAMVSAWVSHWPAGLLIAQVAAMYVFSGLSGSKTADVPLQLGPSCHNH